MTHVRSLGSRRLCPPIQLVNRPLIRGVDTLRNVAILVVGNIGLLTFLYSAGDCALAFASFRFLDHSFTLANR
jgi:hypothetical protein